MPRSSPLDRLRAGPERFKLGQLFNTRKRIANKIITLAQLAMKPKFHWNQKEDKVAPDPVVIVCRALPQTQYGRIGLYHHNLEDIPRFSNLMSGRNLDADMEKGLSEAREVYALAANDLVGFVFETNSELFVYTNFDASDRVSCLTLRVRKNSRFIYCLSDLFRVTKVINETDISTGPGT